MLSINPDAASRADIARLASELMEANHAAPAALKWKWDCKSIVNLENAAFAWWRSRRPLTFTKKMHLRDPTINCVSRQEIRLARAVDHYYKKLYALRSGGKGAGG